ncbi:MAG: tRNA (adenosine(37)-N6)-threonylcarbamoyltransferase complex ATPase subunit type 1 TsaE [Treponema sp.]|jgi:tRNA threonylcarbamoyladenosine biosynthesis protein TsaE|nr:tRNA (adenosine(37)-N6)-threonylcarbamoyltransferase complex ATPase subunit type 1 TsaE [Treponema sp.]
MSEVFLIELVSNSPQETFALGQQIANSLFPGSLVALYGTLGSGKTHLTKGIAFGLGLTENITSPTYTIINEYSLPDNNIFYHIDAYRLDNENDFTETGILEIIHSNGICIIEWSERISKNLPCNTISIFLEISEQNANSSCRKIRISGLDKL